MKSYKVIKLFQVKLPRVPLPANGRQDIKFMDNRMFNEASPMKQGVVGNGVPLIPAPSPLIANNNYMQQVIYLWFYFLNKIIILNWRFSWMRRWVHLIPECKGLVFENFDFRNNFWDLYPMPHWLSLCLKFKALVTALV